MADEVTFRRGDWATAGIKRTATSTVRSTITEINLNIESIQPTATHELNVTKRKATDLPHIHTVGRCEASWTMVGDVIKDRSANIEDIYFLLDLLYATVYWYLQGDVTLIWTRHGVTTTTTGEIQRFVPRPIAGEMEAIGYTLVFIQGTTETV